MKTWIETQQYINKHGELCAKYYFPDGSVKY
ncbi:hypothetical protein LCGC14_2727190, partial [marine sediment metagenome]